MLKHNHSTCTKHRSFYHIFVAIQQCSERRHQMQHLLQTQLQHQYAISELKFTTCMFWMKSSNFTACTINQLYSMHTHTHLTALFPGLPRWAGTRTVKPMWILLKQETVSRSGISWARCKSVSRSRQITMPAPHHSIFFTGRMPFLPPNQQRQSTEALLYALHLICLC